MKNFILSVSLLSLLFVFAQPVKSQEKPATKLFYTELGGPGVLMSANFDSRFKPDERLGFGYRVGFTPIIGTSGDLFPMVGISFGYAF
ncbi:hypothetical protein FACS189426_07520 [Bacteroidia bacterium]|nr:hypothetical protein FACS189426_07520 [Bacteroidia bacterium]